MYNFTEYKKRSEPYKFVSLSFDDSVMQDIRFTRLLEKYGLIATFNLNSGLFGQKDRLFYGGEGKSVDHSGIPGELIRTVYDGHEVAAHTLHHPALCDCDDETVFHEIEDDRAAIEALSGQKVIGMAYPGMEKYNDTTIEVIKKRTALIYARGGRQTYSFDMPTNLLRWQPTCHYRDEGLLPLFEKFATAESEEDTLFLIVGHSYEFDIFSEWDKIESILSIISEKQGVTCAASGEIASYLLETERNG